MARGINKSMLIDRYKDGLSIPELSCETKIPKSTIRMYLKTAGVLRNRTDGVRSAAARGRLGNGLRGKKRVFSEAHKEAISAAKLRRGELHAKGVSKKPSGYIEITRGPNKGRGQHRVVMEEYIGRPLSASEHVHHEDEDRANNDISNLELLTSSAHMSLHANKKHHSRARNKNGTWR